MKAQNERTFGENVEKEMEFVGFFFWERNARNALPKKAWTNSRWGKDVNLILVIMALFADERHLD